MIERRIITGLITSTEFIQQIQPVWNIRLLESEMARRLAGWCMEYFEKYSRAPGSDIEGIYFSKLQEGLPKDIAEEIEQDILPGLSEEYSKEKFNLDYLIDQTHQYFKQRHLTLFSEQIQTLVDEGNLLEAEKLAYDYKPAVAEIGSDIDLSDETSLKRIEEAFSKETFTPIIRYPKQLGEFWNRQLVRESFVSLMATEKRGKSYWLLDMAMRGCRQGVNVAFFQAGDMTEKQQLRRMGVYLTKKSYLKKECGVMYQPVRDCIHNQLNTCNREERECGFGVFEDRTEKELRREITLNDLKEQYETNPDYLPCYNCDEYKKKQSRLGAVWIEEVDVGEPLTAEEVVKAAETFFINKKRRFKLSTHINDTLSITQIKTILDIWEKQDGFVPDLIVIDYADILIEEMKMDFRHQQNKIWKGLRSLSQERHCLVITATQADAQSYEQDRLRMKNFSEDKRKYAHVTAMYGLNQDKNDREKKLNLMRINEIVIREADYSNLQEVTVLQNLKRGQPFLGSFW